MKPFTLTALLREPSAYRARGTVVHAIARKSRLLTLTSAMLAIAPLCFAQVQTPDPAQVQTPGLASSIQVVRANTQAERVGLISQAMDFTDKDAAAFWPIYRKYEYERATLDDRRVAVLKEYTSRYAKLTDADAKGMAEQMIDCDARFAELKKKYFKKFNAVLPALTVAKFFQLEHRIDLLIDTRVESSFPLITQSKQAQEQNYPPPPSDAIRARNE